MKTENEKEVMTKGQNDKKTERHRDKNFNAIINPIYPSGEHIVPPLPRICV